MSVFKNEIYKNSRMREFLFFFFIIFTIIFIFFELKNGRYWQSDFEVYYKSAKRALLGENLYRPDEDGFYRFKYSPFSAYLFIPFTLFSFTYAKYLYSFFISLLMFFNFLYCFLLGSEILIEKLKNKKNINSYLILVFLFSLLPLGVFYVRELHLGQINILLLFLYIYSFYLLRHNNNMSFFILAISCFIKPYFLIFLMYFLYQKNIKAVFLTIFSVIFIGFIPLFTYKFKIFIEQNYLWFNELKIEIFRQGSVSGDSNISLFSFIDRYFPISFNNSIIIKKMFIISLCGLFLVYFFNKTKILLSKNLKIFYDFSLLCLFISLLTSNGKSVYILLLPSIFIISSVISKYNYFLIILFSISCAILGLDIGDGGIYTKWIRTYYLLPSSGLILIICLLISLKKANSNYISDPIPLSESLPLTK